MKHGLWIASLIVALSLSAFVGAQGRQGRRGPGGNRPPDMPLAVVPAHDLDLVLARPTTTSVTLSVLASVDTDATLTYEPGGGQRRLPLKSGVPFEVEITELSADQSYRYTIAGTSGPLVTGTFRTARPGGAPFTFAVQADSHLDANTDPQVYVNTLSHIVADQPDFLVDLGDTFMTDKFPKFTDAVPQYLAQRYYLGLAGRTMPIFLTLGNHDGEVGWSTRDSAAMTTWARDMRDRFFPPVRTNAFYTAGSSASPYYAWKWGDALFIVLDPFSDTRTRPGQVGDGWTWTLGREQYEWLERTLSSSRARYTFVFIHHLVGGRPDGRAAEARGGAEASRFFEWGGANADGSPGFEAHRAGWRMPIHELLRAHRVTAVFHGHDHLYVHQERDGIAYQEVPQPGHARGDSTNSAAEYGYASGTLLGSSGHLRVAVSSRAATVEYVRSRLTGPEADVADRYVLNPSEQFR